jgi:type III secretion protein V
VAERRPRWGLEAAIAAVVIAVVAMMVVPMPRLLLDTLLTINLAASVLLLLAAVMTPRPLRFSAFPTLLVVTTLFRAGLNVSTTRLILADGDAGSVVRAFGSQVAAQSLVVGLVVFAVITIIQLIVVARGAERVAEVAARFALDAMPGKQMAIDAEVRSGALDREGARRRRDELDRESQLYGAMDGAMRFVKGDAVAAIVIVVINLVGGLIVGLGYRKMAIGDAVTTYSILSIGEGLVSQIPSLLVAVASGLLVTRVAASGNRALSDDLAPEIFAEPRALGGVALLLGGLALVPGMPLPPFLILAAVAGGLAWWASRWRRGQASEAARVAAEAGEAGESGEGEADLAGDASSALLVRVGGAAAGAGRGGRLPPAAAAELAAALRAVRRAVTARTGVPLPALPWRRDPALADGVLEVDFHGTPVVWLALRTGAPEADAEAKIESKIEAKIEAMIEAIKEHLPAALVAAAPELVELDTVQRLLDAARRLQPVLVREVVPSMIGVPALTEVVRGLVREQVPLGDFAPVLAALAAIPAPAAKEPAELVELVRARMQRQIRWRWAPRGELAVFTLDGLIEDAVRTSIDRRDGQAVLALEPDIAQDILRAVREATADTADGVILTSGDVRRHLRALLAAELPHLAVLAPHELPAGTSVKATARITV